MTSQIWAVYKKNVDPDSREKGILWTEGMERAGCWISFMWQKHLLFSGLCFLRGFCDGFRGALCPFDERTRKSLHRRLSFGVNILCCKGHCCVSFKKKRKKNSVLVDAGNAGIFFFFFTSSYHWCPCRRVRVFFTRLCGSGGRWKSPITLRREGWD